MKVIIFVAALVACALAAPPSYKDAYIVKYENNNIGLDGYDFAVETSDGTVRQEQAKLVNVGTENEALVVTGFYRYFDEYGNEYRVDFVADENGFRPVGAHLPK